MNLNLDSTEGINFLSTLDLASKARVITIHGLNDDQVKQIEKIYNGKIIHTKVIRVGNTVGDNKYTVMFSLAGDWS